MDASPYVVRRLQAADADLVAPLMEVFGRAFEDAETYGAQPPRRAYLERLLGDDTCLVLVAVEAGAVIGGLAAYELRKIERERSEVYIYDLAVDEPHRRRGVATALIRALGAIAAARGAAVMFVQADYGDDPAIALYTKLGTREDVMHFDIATLPPG
ncbi:MAG: AAC(3)-I family aminoglycoside N-acetyltransferase [Hyphomonadaceae bacterium]|nr:AAC(3)-I family aminoglycoside N-acetyltransferase [Hyphomonadaceae bacterium]